MNYRKILFLSKVILVFLPAPIYKVKYVRDHIWVLASTRALLEKKKKKKKKIAIITTLQEVFELSKNIVPIKSYTSFLASPYY